MPRALARLEATLEPLSGRHHPSNAQRKAARDILATAGVIVSLFRCDIVRHLLDLDKMVHQLSRVLQFTASVLEGATSLLDVSPSAADELLSVTFGLLELLLQPGDAKLGLTEAHVLSLWRGTLQLVDVDHEQARLVALQAMVALLAMPGVLPEADVKPRGKRSEAGEGAEARARDLLSRLGPALTAPEPAPSLAARAARLILEAIPQLESTLESYGIAAAVLEALQPQVTKALWTQRDKPSGPPEGAPDSTAVAWLASVALYAQSSSPLYLCQEHGLAWKMTAALLSLQAVRRAAPRKAAPWFFVGGFFFSFIVFFPRGTAVSPLTALLLTLTALPNFVISALVQAGVSDPDHQHAIVSIVHFVVSETVKAARRALQLQSNAQRQSTPEAQEATATAEALLEQTSVLLTALPSLLALCSSEAQEVGRGLAQPLGGGRRLFFSGRLYPLLFRRWRCSARASR